MITDDKQINSCLEQICEQGCRSVNQVIQQLDQGEVIEDIAHLSRVQQQRLLQELKSIMAVYAVTGSCEVWVCCKVMRLFKINHLFYAR